jgi:methionyl-tRNA formyltransferase
MNIIFFGSSDFSAKVLSCLQREEKISLVVTQAPKPAGRHYRRRRTPVEDLARQSGLEVFAPQLVNARESVERICSADPDLFIVISYGQILSPELLNCAKVLPAAIHPSLLPRYRGASPINAALMNGDEVTGVTFIKMNATMDAGELIIQERADITGEDTAITLSEKLAALSCAMLDTFFEKIQSNSLILTPQNCAEVTFAPKLTKQTGRIQWKASARQIHNLIRAMVPWPVAFTGLSTHTIRIFESALSPAQYPARSGEQPGNIIGINSGGIEVATGKGVLLVKKLQREGRKILGAEDFARGGQVKAGDRFV